MSLTETQKKKSLRLEAWERSRDLLTAALSLVGALAWNDAVQTLFKTIFGEAASVYAKFLYAIFVTLVIIVLMRYLSHLSSALHGQADRDSQDA